jgi:hypothetical protein
VVPIWVKVVRLLKQEPINKNVPNYDQRGQEEN